MQVRDFMITKVITAKPSFTIKEILMLFVSNRIGGVPVVDDKEHLIGMVSDGDVLRYLTPKPRNIISLYYLVYADEAEKLEEVLEAKLDTPVKVIMTKKNLETVSPDDDFEKTMRLLSQNHFKKLPVLNGAGRVIGILSRGDLVYNLSKKIISQ
jgi:CBS domain-containing protein